MGQPITVVRKPTTRPGVVRFEINRSLTGMGHERYRSDVEVAGNRPPDELARRLFAAGGVDSVHVYSNEITVELSPGSDPEALGDTLEKLFIHYTEGVTPSLP
jgi:scaffold Nfu/NifU family protein